MLRTHTISQSTIALISVMVILGIAMGAVAYLQMVSPAPSVPAPAENPTLKNFGPAPAFANPVVAHSLYISEQTLRRWLDDAYEKHQTTRVLTLLRILNGRYERRCCGSPY